MGSSTYSAQLAASLGLPFAFASHFAPALLIQALEVYRREFRPSQYLDIPYVMVGVPLVAAETDAEARWLATSAYQRGLQLMRGQAILVPPPVDTMDGLWNDAERYIVESRLLLAAIGGPHTVRHKLEQILAETHADELIFTSDLYDHAKRLRSFQIAAQAIAALTPVELQRV